MADSDTDKTLAVVQASCPPEDWPFVEAFLCEPELNIAKAEKACGWPAGAGKRALAKSRVRNVIGQILQDVSARHTKIRDKALFTMAQIAFYDPADAWSEDHRLLHIRDMPLAVRMSVTEYQETIKPNGDVFTKVKFSDRVKVLEMVLKTFQAFEEEDKSTDQLANITLRGVQKGMIDATPEGED